MEETLPMRAHGFERPFHPLQVLSWIVFSVNVLLFLIFGFPLVDTDVAKVSIAICYATSVLVVVLATIKATNCDPADPHVRLQDVDLKTEGCESMPFCTLCSVPVYARSKHCRACNKCIHVFDHHCMWLNNCIGAANYRAFAVVVSSVAAMIGIVLGTCLYLLVDYLFNGDAFEDRLEGIAIFRYVPKETFLGVLVFMVFVNGPLFVLDMQLVILHAFLSSQHLTTYEYIMNKRNMQLEEPDYEEAVETRPPRLKTLPSCMDWIVFARCGTKRRGSKSKDVIVRIAIGEDHSTSQEAEVAMGSIGDQAAVLPMVHSTVLQAGHAERPPSPPGSTTDVDEIGGETEDGVGVDDLDQALMDACTSSASGKSPQLLAQQPPTAEKHQAQLQTGDAVAAHGGPTLHGLIAASSSIAPIQDNPPEQKQGHEIFVESPSTAGDTGGGLAAKLGCSCDTTARLPTVSSKV